jgi:predicted nucleotide-binding protein (sugar kinase/HSP70/actin superfamily)
LPGFAKEELISALHKSVKELQQGIDMHSCLIASILENEVDERHLKPFFNNCSLRSRECQMKEAIREAIEVLEESRKSFKSKRLEALRKRLTQVLIDTE